MDTRTPEEKMENIKKYEDSELFVRDWLNAHEGKGYEKVYGPEVKWDIIGPKTHEVKSFKIGKQPAISQDCYINCKADYITFVEVDEQAAPTGRLITANWRELRKRVTRDTAKNGWIQVQGRRFCSFIPESDLLSQPWAVELSDTKKEKIDDLLLLEARKYLDEF